MSENIRMDSLLRLVKEMEEDFLISESYSRIIAEIGDDDQEAQDVIKHIDLMKHAYLCKKGASFCKDFLIDHDLNKLVFNLNKFKFYENVTLIRNIIFNISYDNK